MKSSARIIILGGGSLNFLLACFHIFLCYQIFHFYGAMPVYPLLQMFAIGGMIMIFFLAYTSLVCPAELVSTKFGKPVLMLNILVYLTRILGVFVLFLLQDFSIIALCSFLTILYIYIFIQGSKNVQENEVMSQEVVSR
jgi:apolipoprotein N-acyltransferase